MDNELIKLITIIAIPTVTIVASNMALHLNLSKKIDNLSDRITKLEVEIVKLQSRFDVLEGKQTDIEKRFSELKTETDKQNETTNSRLIQIETDNKTKLNDLINKVLDVFPKSAL